MIPVVLLLLAGAFVFSLGLTWVLVRVGRRMGTVDSAGSVGHVKELRGVPNIGGVAVFAAVALPLLVGIVMLGMFDAAWWAEMMPAVAEHLPRARATLPTAMALLASITMLHMMGLVDDRRALSPWLKLAVQLGAAVVMAVWFDVRLLTLLGPGLSIVVTVVWILAITNAINFIDNMDGLCAGVCAIAGSMFMVATLVNAQWFIAATLALLVGGLLGFLVFNFPPAKIFMGDGGSLVVGFLLAVLTARTTFYEPGLAAQGFFSGVWYAVFMPVVVLAIPLYDLVTVTTIRLRQGRSPLVGDQQHFSHRLVERGMSRRGAVMVIWGLTLVTSVGGIALGSLRPWQAALVGVQTVCVLGVVWLLEHATRRSGGAGEGKVQEKRPRSESSR